MNKFFTHVITSLIKWILIYLIMALLTVVALAYLPLDNKRSIDCSMSEFHPDVSPAIKDQCRKIRSTSV